MRKLLLLSFVFMSFLAVSLGLPQEITAAATQQQIQVMIDGTKVEAEVPPLIHNGRTLVPVRLIAEGLGAEVAWDEQSKTATITRETNQLVLQLNQVKAKINGKEVSLDAAPMIKNERMLLPLRFVGEALGTTIGWEEQTRTVVANRPIAVQINGLSLANEVKAYQMEGTVYLPVDQTLKRTGYTGKGRPQQIKQIDDTDVAPYTEIARLIDGQAEWDVDANQLSLESFAELEGITVNGETVFVKTSRPVTANHFTMTGPHRVVIDIPHSKLSAEMNNQLQQQSGLNGQNEDDDQRTEQPEWLQKEQEDEETQPAEQSGVHRLAFSENEEHFMKEIRYSQYSLAPYSTRVVIELTQKSRYYLTPSEQGLEISLVPLPPKTGYLVVIDAGHGGSDPGAIGTADNYEKDFTLAVANRMVELLKQYPEFQVVPTRTTDVYPTLEERVQLANEVEADLFISIHANSFTNPNVRGTETHYYHSYSKDFAEVVHRHLVSATQFPDRKVKVSPFYVIRHTKMPAVLIETGFLSNAEENAQLQSPALQQRVAEAMVAAIHEYYKNY